MPLKSGLTLDGMHVLIQIHTQITVPIRIIVGRAKPMSITLPLICKSKEICLLTTGTIVISQQKELATSRICNCLYLHDS